MSRLFFLDTCRRVRWGYSVRYVTLSDSEGSLLTWWRFFAAKSKSAAQNDMRYDKNRLRVILTGSLFLKGRATLRWRISRRRGGNRARIVPAKVQAIVRCVWEIADYALVLIRFEILLFRGKWSGCRCYNACAGNFQALVDYSVSHPVKHFGLWRRFDGDTRNATLCGGNL